MECHGSRKSRSLWPERILPFLGIFKGHFRKKEGVQDSDMSFFIPIMYYENALEYNKQLWAF
jgi:hypothetical protein